VELGFFELDTKGISSPNTYLVLNHKEWVQKHPDRTHQCAVKFEYVWSGDGDALGQLLSAQTGFRAKMLPFQMATIRKTGLSDEILIAKFREYYSSQGRHKKSRNVFAGFIVSLQASKLLERVV
jgi:hypothetical protein